MSIRSEGWPIVSLCRCETKSNEIHFPLIQRTSLEIVHETIIRCPYEKGRRVSVHGMLQAVMAWNDLNLQTGIR